MNLRFLQYYLPLVLWLAILALGSGSRGTVYAGGSESVYATPGDSLRVGVALSGGSALGLAHIGVLDVLEELEVPIDLVTGTSMGGIVGGLYAAGYGPAALEQIALEENWSQLFSDRPPRLGQPLSYRLWADRYMLRVPLDDWRPALPSGFIRGHHISLTLAYLTLTAHGTELFSDLPTPFACIGTDLETGEAIRLDRGNLARSLRATMAIPTIFSPVRIDGRMLVDGGLVRNLPAEDARDMGADYVICVIVSSDEVHADRLTTLTDVMMQSVTIQLSANILQQRAYCDRIIEVDLGELSSTDFQRADSLMARGRRAAQQHDASLRALAETAGRRSYEAGRHPSITQDITINDVAVHSETDVLAEYAHRALGLTLPATLTLDELRATINRMYGTRRFAQVFFYLEPMNEQDTFRLVLEVEERMQGTMGLGLRYDTANDAALLAGLTSMDYLGFGNTFEGHVRLGRLIQLSGSFSRMSLRNPNHQFVAGLHLARLPQTVHEDGQRVAALSTYLAELTTGWRFAPAPTADASLGLHAEFFETRTSTGLNLDRFLQDNTLVIGPALHFRLDTFDRRAFAMRGQRLSVHGAALNVHGPDRTALDPEIEQVPLLSPPEAEGTFLHGALEWSARWPLVRDRLSMHSMLVVGHNVGASRPLHYMFSAGGASPQPAPFMRQHPFPGLRDQEVLSNTLQLVQLGATARVGSDWYVSVEGNVAHEADEFLDVDREKMHAGIALRLGMEFLTIPFELTYGNRFDGGNGALAFSVGLPF